MTLDPNSYSSGVAAKRPPKRLIFDRRYGWVFDEWKNPSEEALAGGRGMFCILPLTKSLVKIASHSVSMDAPLDSFLGRHEEIDGSDRCLWGFELSPIAGYPASPSSPPCSSAYIYILGTYHRDSHLEAVLDEIKEKWADHLALVSKFAFRKAKEKTKPTQGLQQYQLQPHQLKTNEMIFVDPKTTKGEEDQAYHQKMAETPLCAEALLL
ncbi:hypothetical protein HHK36_009231 [Tetracentron sinense]|uniref:Uncharacterized protein n=1 Tax=Tetracentron sinense TaxID=13715 RepID=A0A834ZFW6_TETSI|nr:hypothetical protein HHK36_009231 [Tetracentron sinense]